MREEASVEVRFGCYMVLSVWYVDGLMIGMWYFEYVAFCVVVLWSICRFFSPKKLRPFTAFKKLYCLFHVRSKEEESYHTPKFNVGRG
jgi:hypothetical protein